jgi:hypothetical protein
MAWFKPSTTTTRPKPRTDNGLPGSIPQDFAPRFILREDADQRRPCWVRGRKALFHCWANTAHPVAPRNIPAELIDEKTRFFQFRRTDGLVEFEDGTVARVYASEIQFADGGGFEKYEWLPMTEGGAGRWRRVRRS